MNIEKKLYQWDTEQKLTGCTGLYVDFPIGNEVYRVETADGTCIIPDELLQTSGSHKVYECMTNNTIRSFAFSVTPRLKPPDYVYTPTERLTFEGLVQRVDDAVADMIRRAESGEFDGHTPVKGTDYFTTGEIQQIQNEVSSGAIGEFKSVVDTETETFNTNVESKLTTYNENDVAKTGAYNTNASNKVTEYNSNAENKTAEFDTHTEQIQADISELKSDLVEINNLVGCEWSIGYVNSYGIVTHQDVGSNRRYSSKILCGENVELKFMGESNHSGISVLTCYDANDTAIQKNINVGEIETECSCVTPIGTKYIRLSIVADKTHYVKTSDSSINIIKTYIDSCVKELDIIESTAKEGDTTWVIAKLEKGKKYRITNNASGQISASAWTQDKSTTIDTYGKIDSGESLIIYPTEDAYYLAYFTISGTGTVLIADMSKRLTSLESRIDTIPSKILLLGDSVLGYDNSMKKYLSELTGSEILNSAIGGTSVSARTDTASPFYAFDGINLVTAISTGDFSTQDANVEGTGYAPNIEKLNTLKTLDYSKVNLIVIGYGTNDYTQGKTIEQITTALNTCVDLLQQKNPLCKILILSPIWRYFSNGTDGDTRVYNVSTLKEISNGIVEWAENKRISVLDGYKNFELNQNTMSALCVDDDGSYVHLKPIGAERYAHLINGKIRSLY